MKLKGVKVKDVNLSKNTMGRNSDIFFSRRYSYFVSKQEDLRSILNGEKV